MTSHGLIIHFTHSHSKKIGYVCHGQSHPGKICDKDLKLTETEHVI